MRVDRALRGLGKSVKAEFFDDDHIQVIGPLILGEAIWTLYAHEEFFDWNEFKKAVERRFGLNKE